MPKQTIITTRSVSPHGNGDFYRCGARHTRQGQDFLVLEAKAVQAANKAAGNKRAFTPQEVEILKAEPMLVVSERTDGADDTPKTSKTAKADDTAEAK